MSVCCCTSDSERNAALTNT